MADLGGVFDAKTVEPNNGFDTIPAGDYRACITASEIKQTNDGQGRYVKLTFQLLDDPYKNRKLWENLNLWNKSAEAVRIAQGTLSGIGRAVNVLEIKDTSQLHNLPLIIKLKVKTDKDGNKENRIGGYKPCHAGPQQQQTFAASQPATTSTPFAGQTAPWGGPA